MNNLTALLREARRLGEHDLRTFQVTLDCFASAMDLKWDWDSGVPENWASFVDAAGTHSVFLWRSGHFAFVGGANRDEISAMLNAEGILTVTVQDWDAETFCVDPEAFRELFDCAPPSGGRDDPNEVNPHSLSANDLWWTTVT